MMNGSLPRVPGVRPTNGTPLYDSGALSDGHSPRPPRSTSSHPPSHPHSIPHSSSSGSHTPPIKRNTVQSSRAPAPGPSSTHVIAVPTPPPPSASPYSARRVLPFLILVIMTLSLPLLYLLSSSSLVSSTLCSSLISSQAAVTMKSISLLNPSPSSSLSPFTPFLFPTPTPFLYITSYPDPAAQLSTQFAQWLYGPYLSLTLNISYTFTPLSKLSSRYSSFLGFGYSESTEADLLSTFARSRIFIHKDDQRSTPTAVDGWIRDKRKKVDHINTQLTHYHTKHASFPDLPPPTLDEPKGSILDGYDTTHVDPSQPVTTVTVFRLYRVAAPSLMMACHPPLLALLRAKYCAARVRKGVVDMYRDDRQAGHMIVAMALVCGEQCFTDKAVPLSSSIATIQRLTDIAARHSLPPPSFHIFTTPPSNATSTPSSTPSTPPSSTSSFFAPLTALPFVRLHLNLHSHLAFHHLVQSDVLVAPALSSSSTSWLAQLMHHGVVVSPSVPQHACRGEVGLYNQEAGGFDEDSFVKVWKEVGPHTQRYDKITDCASIT